MIKISVITPTFRREDLLARCVESVLAQQVDAQIEHIVVNDNGSPLGHAAWMEDPRARVVNTFRTERCFARNTGAALADGEWLYFLDDDDYTQPGAFAALLEIAQQTDAVHVYGGYRVLNEAQQTSTDIQPVVPADMFPRAFTGEIIPLQASWLRRSAFFKIGGFDTTFYAAEDNDLFRRLSFLGSTVGTPYICAIIRAEHRTTTSSWSRQQEFTGKSLEKIAALPQVVPRLAAGTRRSPYWRGRCVRAYFTLARYGLHERRWSLTGLSLRAGGRLSLRYGLVPSFWSGFRRD